ncbi:hypothetical protein EI94DRAFT_176219 [Lactarius quietus]|nr:hypothetical protein EI94DRAFT_176219 [Lactarius quietus]
MRNCHIQLSLLNAARPFISVVPRTPQSARALTEGTVASLLCGEPEDIRHTLFRKDVIGFTPDGWINTWNNKLKREVEYVHLPAIRRGIRRKISSPSSGEQIRYLMADVLMSMRVGGVTVVVNHEQAIKRRRDIAAPRQISVPQTSYFGDHLQFLLFPGTHMSTASRME